MTREDIQKLTDDYAKTLNTRKPQPAATATDADFFAPEKAENALFTIKRLVAKAGVQDSIKKYLLQRNSVIAANKAKQKEKEKQKENKHVSHPNWY